MLEPSFLTRLRDPEIRNILIVGCGGGFDFVHSMLLYPTLMELGKNVVIGSYSFGLPEKLPADAPMFESGSGAAVRTVNGSMEPDPHYAPEINLCRYLDDTYPGRAHEIYAFYARDFTVGNLGSLYRRLCGKHDIDAVLAFDGGSDSLMAGDEAGLGDVVEDLTSVTAIEELDVKLKMMFVIGMGADRYNDVSDASALRAVAELSADNGFRGSVSIEKGTEAHNFYREAVSFIFSKQTFRSTVASFILSSIDGYYGCQDSEHLPFPEGEERRYHIWPLMSVLWAFDIDAVARRSLIPEALRSCESVAEGWRSITDLRRSIAQRIRPMENFPGHEEMRRTEQYNFTTGSLEGGLFDEVEELESPDEPDLEDFMDKYNTVAASMVETGDWYYINGSYKGSLDFTKPEFTRVGTPKHLGLGRSDFYDRFLDEMSGFHGHKVHQSDYMMWIRPSDPYMSLNFYINTAENIEFSLEGVSAEDIRKAVAPGRRVTDRRALDTRYMTLWEINQVVFSKGREKTTWHIRGGLSPDSVIDSFGGLVSPKRIVEDFQEAVAAFTEE